MADDQSYAANDTACWPTREERDLLKRGLDNWVTKNNNDCSGVREIHPLDNMLCDDGNSIELCSFEDRDGEETPNFHEETENENENEKRDLDTHSEADEDEYPQWPDWTRDRVSKNSLPPFFSLPAQRPNPKS